MDELNLNDLPELPFELILSYLSLEDRIKARVVSRRWCKIIDSFKVKHLCLSQRSRDFIRKNSRWADGTFAKNFICSPEFEKFFRTFGQSILSNLKKLRLCDPRLNAKEATALAQALNSFGRLEELDIIQFNDLSVQEPKPDFELNLSMPMLTSIQFDGLYAIKKLTLEAPKLRKIRIWESHYLKVHLVHAESVERLFIGSQVKGIELKKMKNLKYLYTEPHQTFDPALLANLEQLKEIHLTDERDLVGKLFEQKKRYGRTSLRIFLCGVLLDGPNDPVLVHPVHEDFAYLAEHSSKLAEEVPFIPCIEYPTPHDVPIEHEINVLKRYTDSSTFFVLHPIPDIERFLVILKNLNNIELLQFSCDQPQNLFDRLPDHCATVQMLEIQSKLTDFRFLFKFKHLNDLKIGYSIGLEHIRTIMGELPFLSEFRFKYLKKSVIINVENAKQLDVWADDKFESVSNLDTAIKFIVEA